LYSSCIKIYDKHTIKGKSGQEYIVPWTGLMFGLSLQINFDFNGFDCFNCDGCRITTSHGYEIDDIDQKYCSKCFSEFKQSNRNVAKINHTTINILEIVLPKIVYHEAGEN
jgi:hypothetical protein